MKIRTSTPSNNKYYIRQVSGGLNGALAGQPTIKGANVLCNCVGYANGRFNEIIGDPDLIGTVKAFGYQLVCNAEDFIESARRQGLTISPTPIEGGIMVWAKGRPGRGSDGAGHVAVVEEVYDDGTILTTESGWNAWAFKTVRRSNANGRWGQTSAYSFRGCVVNPGVPNPKVVPVPPLVVDGIGGEATVMAMQRFFGTPVDGIISGQIKGLHRYYPSLTAVSYIGAPSTCIVALQKWLGVPADGYLGADTTKAWQRKLGVKDDGIFGADSMRAWQTFLNDNKEPTPTPPEPTPEPTPTKKLEEDGIGGPATIKVAQAVFGTQVDGNVSGQNKALKKYYPSLTAVTFDKVKSTLVKRLQKWVGVTDDGVWGAATSKGMQHKLNSEGYDAGDEDSIFGARSMRAFQAWLNDHDSPTPDTPQPTPSPTPKPSHPVIATAEELAWPKDTPESTYKYPKGKPTAAFKAALDEVYPSHKNWGAGPKTGASCDVGVGTVMRYSGVDPKYPRGISEQKKHTSDKLTKLVYENVRPIDVAKPGDAVLYTKNKSGSSNHTIIMGDGCFYEAQLKKTYFHKKTSMTKLKTKRPKVYVFRKK